MHYNPPDTSSALDTSANVIVIPSLVLNKVRIVYKDVVTGSDMDIMVNHLDTKIDKLDAGNLIFDLPHTTIDGLTARIYQVKPLATPEPLSKDIAEAEQPSSMLLDFKDVKLKNIHADYRNDVSAMYTQLDIGALDVTMNKLDLTNRILELNNVSLTIHLLPSVLAKRTGKNY
jgi:hypothetical protein